MRRIEKRFNKDVVQYGLIEDGDKILVGLSEEKIHLLYWNYLPAVRVFTSLVFQSLLHMS